MDHAFILHQRNYKETSLLIEAFTREHGRISLVANGAKRIRSKWRGILMPFIPLSINWGGKTDKLLTLIEAEVHGKLINLYGFKLISGFYINELILKLLAPFDPHADLYDYYNNTMIDLATAEHTIEPILRKFELNLLTEIGFKLQLSQDVYTKQPIYSDANYLFDPTQGPIQVQYNSKLHNNSRLVFAGKTLIEIQKQNFQDPTILLAAKQLMRQVINYYLAGRELETRKVYFPSPAGERAARSDGRGQKVGRDL
jgi:DNA repair protein RecO (recombination protein O)